jgi:DNA (cytosine-5)-methyltransferase 1
MHGKLRPNAADTSRLEDAVAVNLLPTPRASDGEKGGPNQRGSSGDLMLPSAVQQIPLLPTATAGDALGSRNSTAYRHPDRGIHDSRMPPPEPIVEWGPYAPAIRRAEQTFAKRPAPNPTEPATRGGRRLSPLFVEWHMGLPAGHVTDPTIWEGMTNAKGRVLTGTALETAARNAQLKALGNGVVYQQAEAAVRAYFHDRGLNVAERYVAPVAVSDDVDDGAEDWSAC